MEPSYDALSVKAKRQRRVVRTRVIAALASGATFGAAVVGFALHDHSASRSTTVSSSSTPTTTFSQPGATSNDDGFGTGATPGGRSGGSDSGTRGS